MALLWNNLRLYCVLLGQFGGEESWIHGILLVAHGDISDLCIDVVFLIFKISSAGNDGSRRSVCGNVYHRYVQQDKTVSSDLHFRKLLDDDGAERA